MLVGHVSNGTNATIGPNGGKKKKKQGKKGGRERSTLSVADTDEEFILWHWCVRERWESPGMLCQKQWEHWNKNPKQNCFPAGGILRRLSCWPGQPRPAARGDLQQALRGSACGGVLGATVWGSASCSLNERDVPSDLTGTLSLFFTQWISFWEAVSYQENRRSGCLQRWCRSIRCVVRLAVGWLHTGRGMLGSVEPGEADGETSHLPCH